MRYPPAPDRRAGLTLTELLVAIVIIGVLISVLMGAMGPARKHTQSVQCISNLRQCGIALLSYATEHKNQLDMAAGGSGVGPYMWTEYVANYVAPQHPDLTKVRTPSIDILYCPSYAPFKHDPGGPDLKNWQGNCYGAYFVANSYVTKAVVTENGKARTMYQLKLAAVPALSEHALLIDSIVLSNKVQGFNINGHVASSDKASVHLRHGGKAYVLFLDGHVAGQDRSALKRIGFYSGYGEDQTLMTF